MSAAVDMRFAFLPGVLRFLPGRGQAEALTAVGRMLARWPVQLAAPAADQQPLLVVQPLDGGGFRLHGVSPEATAFTPARPGQRGCLLAPGYSFEPTLACLACTLAIELVAVHEALAAPCMGVHGAAATRHGLTLLFCGQHRAGKSALLTELMLAGWQGIGDDMLGLSPQGEVVAYGLAPRLRLPLPPSRRLPAFLAQAAHVACADSDYLCCDPLALPLCPTGARLPVDGIVLLDRRDSGEDAAPAALEAPAGSLGLRAMLQRFLLRDGKAGQALVTASRLVEQVPCRILRYTSLEEAVTLLDCWPGEGVSAPGLPAADPAVPPGLTGLRGGRVLRRRTARRPHDRRVATEAAAAWRQRPGTVFRKKGEGGFLARDERACGLEGRIFHLNSMGCVLWQLWETAGSEAELAELLEEAFPGTAPRIIRRDVRRLRQQLCAAGFLEAPPLPAEE